MNSGLTELATEAPAKGLRLEAVVVRDEGVQAMLEVGHAFEAAKPEYSSLENAEPKLDLV